MGDSKGWVPDRRGRWPEGLVLSTVVAAAERMAIFAATFVAGVTESVATDRGQPGVHTSDKPHMTESLL